MNDRFKFRARQKGDTHSFSMPQLYSFNKNFIEQNLSGSCVAVARHFMLEDCIFEQCTGLKDKNGKLIYEGDVVRYGLHNCLIEWYKGGFWVNGFTNGASWQIHDLAGSLEVLGNIHENEELFNV